MSKSYINVSGIWYPIKKIFVKKDGVWVEVKYGYINIGGTWKLIHASVYEYTFTANASNINILSLFGSSVINNYTDFKIIVNPGVTISGSTGTTGAAGANGTSSHPDGYQGGTGGSGSPAISFEGISGKNFTIINNGIIKGGDGGTGGKGGNGYSDGGTLVTSHGGPGGPGGAGAPAIYNPNGNTIIITGNAVINGSTGATGATGANGKYGHVTCFLPFQKVLMADGSYKQIKDIKIGDKLVGAYGDINTVVLFNRPLLGGRTLYRINNLINTPEHPIVNGTRDGFVSMDIEVTESERGITTTYDENMNVVKYWYNCINRKTTKIEQLAIGSSVLTINGPETIERLEPLEGYPPETQLYSMDVSGSHTYCVDGYFVGGGANDEDFDYAKGEPRPGVEGFITKRMKDPTYTENVD